MSDQKNPEVSHNTDDGLTPEVKKTFLQNEDLWAIGIGGCLLFAWSLAVFLKATPEEILSPLNKLVGKPGGWESNFLHSFFPEGKSGNLWPIVGVYGICLLYTSPSPRD